MHTAPHESQSKGKPDTPTTMRARFAGLIPLALAAFVTFWVWATPANKYAFDGPTSIPPDPDTILILVLLSVAGMLLAMVAAWRCRLAAARHARWLRLVGAILIALYDLVRFAQAVPYFQG